MKFTSGPFLVEAGFALMIVFLFVDYSFADYRSKSILLVSAVLFFSEFVIFIGGGSIAYQALPIISLLYLRGLTNASIITLV